MQYLFPDGWRWFEEDKKEEEAHKDEENWYSGRGHRYTFLGDHTEEVRHRFDDIKISDLLSQKDQTSVDIGKRIADRLPDYKDGALQLIMKEMTYQDLEKVLYVLPEKAEDRIMSNLNSFCIPIIKGNCILNRNSVSSIEIRMAVSKFEDAINSYDGDFDLEADYED